MVIGIIRKMDVAWLLLESDAPYLRDPDSHQLDTSHLVCQIAELISQSLSGTHIYCFEGSALGYPTFL